MKNKYFSMAVEGNEATVYIYGDIVSWEWLESDISSYTLTHRIEVLEPVSLIHVHINSYGGEFAEGVAIYNALRQHPAKVITYDDAFACSAAVLPYLAGEERIMYPSSSLFLHEVLTGNTGYAKDMRKCADNLDTLTQLCINAYLENVSIDEAKIRELMENETFIIPEDALEWGFATTIKRDSGTKSPSQSARQALFSLVKERMAQRQEEANGGQEAEPEPQQTSEPQEQAQPGELEPENRVKPFLQALMGVKNQ